MIEQITRWLTEIPWLATAIGFIAGHLLKTFMISAEKQAELRNKTFETTQLLAKVKDDRYAEYTTALAAYAQSDDPNFDDFVKISTTGDRYFGHMVLIAEAILAQHVTPTARQNLVELCSRCMEKTIPAHFEALKHIAKKKGLHWKGQFRRSDYQPILSVVEKYGQQPAGSP